MQEINQLTNKMDGKETHKHPLEEEESLKQAVEEHVSICFLILGNAGEASSRYLECQPGWLYPETKSC